MTMTFALLSLANLDSSALVDAVLFAVIAFGIWKMSRIAAVCGLLLYILERVYMWSTVGMTNPIVPALLTVAFITGVRGSFAWRRLRAQQLSIPKL